MSDFDRDQMSDAIPFYEPVLFHEERISWLLRNMTLEKNTDADGAETA